MKTIFNVFSVLVLLFLIAAAVPKGEDFDKEGLARVKKVQGKEIYVMCEPLREYEVVETVNTLATSLLAGQQSIDNQISEMISKSVKREMKGKIDKFDALISEKGQEAILVRFTD